MNKVKTIVLPRPREGGVVYLKLDVWGDPLRLDRRQVGAYDFSIWVLVGKITIRVLKELFK
jgi:hypothetical protein